MGDLETSKPINFASSEASGARAHKPSGAAVPKYKITPQILEELRLAYVGTKREVSANLARLSTRYEMPRHRLTLIARRQGWQIQTRRPWTAAEDAFLLERVRKTSYKKIATELRRGWASVEARVGALQRSQAVQRASAQGFDVEELAGIFGVGLPKVRKWIARGLFGESKSGAGANRVSAAQISRFLRKHVREYSFEHVNQNFFKRVVFGEGQDSPGGG